MIIGQIKDGIVLDHITAGLGMTLYNFLGLDKLDCQVALIKNAESVKMGKKDIIKIDKVIDLDFDALGYVDPGVTVNIIKDGKLAKRQSIDIPERIENIIKCKNPRCITTVEQGLNHIFVLSDKENRVYRCLYCESKAK
ncbi:MAG: aspartate carbamoyltransferase regulatory subunit [Clostridia bacterium]|nr:aspartate carbamoyltransferase regulatory subunit [Clostridia bacterium]MBQ4644550.1 aspartate carbamoyltransferase regulatory subunit [Clostridia bacterium]